MPITVRIEGEDGEPQGLTWTHPRSTALLDRDHPGTSCLRFIDPYGNTLFNQRQLLVLLAELRALGARIRDPELALALRGLTAFVQEAAGRVHTYVRFLGD